MRKKAFTLAEVLITLTIIGIIAAMTIPTLMNKVQDHGYRSGLLKAYSTLQNAYKMAIRDGVSFYDIYTKGDEGKAIVKEYFKIEKGPYLATNGSGCGMKGLGKLYGQSMAGHFRYLNGDTGDYPCTNSSHLAFQLTDSTIISFYTCHCMANIIFVDVNGAKVPNQIGKDIFLFKLFPDLNFIYPFGVQGSHGCFSKEEIKCTLKRNGFNCSLEILKDHSYKIPKE